ncbi:prepilin peptidase [Brevibacillus migulae]|uniref:prepilin peptidase n=1 Tax=Brevibacillus migulae TaxID=1644114 RepID=UPI00106EB2BD|nr:A24 family peptidase [Brevibacillus migulae]
MIEAVISLFLGLAAWSDWQTRRIPNLLVFPFLLGGLLYQIIQGQGMTALGGMFAAFLITLLPVICKGMGMGDQKLLMAFGAWTSYVCVYQLVLGSLVSCLVLFMLSPRTWRKLLKNMRLVVAGWYGHREVWLPAPSESALALPYGLHLFLAYLVLYLMG